MKTFSYDSLCKELGRVLCASLVDYAPRVHENDVCEQLEDVRSGLMDGTNGRLLVPAVGTVVEHTQCGQLLHGLQQTLVRILNVFHLYGVAGAAVIARRRE